MSQDPPPVNEEDLGERLVRLTDRQLRVGASWIEDLAQEQERQERVFWFAVLLILAATVLFAYGEV